MTTLVAHAKPGANRIQDFSIPSLGVWAGVALEKNAFEAVRRKSVLEGCKWDPQVADVETLAPFPLIMRRSVWAKLARDAEQLAAEAAAAELEILSRPALLRRLGLPRALASVLAETTERTPSPGRIIRFDFHHTHEGWRISEANSDVPGGFTEASHFTKLMAEHYPDFEPSGDPAETWCDVLVERFTGHQHPVVALLSAPGYMEDHQVIAFLAERLRERNYQAFLAGAEQIQWRDSRAHLETEWYKGPLDVIVRFYQAEWLARLPIAIGWKHFFVGGRTPVANPASAVISESKRFPLVWDELATALPTWRMLLPETRDPRDAPWLRDDGWLLKMALCNTGDSVSARDWLRPAEWLRTSLAVGITPGRWVAQRRFESVPISTPVGARHVCIGIYTVDGRAAGAYARISPKPVIDYSAADAALLLEDDD